MQPRLHQPEHPQHHPQTHPPPPPPLTSSSPADSRPASVQHLPPVHGTAGPGIPHHPHRPAPDHQLVTSPAHRTLPDMYSQHIPIPAFQQYPQHSQPHQSYQSYPPPPGRMLPPGPSGMLPPVQALSAAPMPAYAAQALPGPLPQQQQSFYAPRQPGPAALTPSASSPSAGAIASEPAAHAGTKGKYRYELRVEQQPQRARMCGFGDKDRRPITPPPCVRLVVTHTDSGREVDHDDLDGSFFVLQVDLWDANGQTESNILRASSSAPTQSISTAVPMPYPPPPEHHRAAAHNSYNPYLDLGMAMPYGQDPHSLYALPPSPASSYHHHHPNATNAGNNSMYPMYVPSTSSSSAAASVHYTRNLIGSLTVNAASLRDLDGKPSYWFVLQDLSVRTEGWFRLRMSFIDVGRPDPEQGLHRARCPVLASTFSDKFQVYSAKKFPGVIESTPLSKCFAGQGIKIPIRKEGKADGPDGADKGDDDDD